ncbi:MAG: hypothetical protein U5R06_02095 [candidate division KSB1 bacterium]|nr:hypothetical protein [candidate division KSB1 bacterium]
MQEFAARIEAALVMGTILNNNNTMQLVGSEKAHQLLKDSNGTVSLEKLVNQIAFSLYASPAEQLKIGITDPESGLPGLSKERGIPLAESIENKLVQTAFYDKLVHNPDIDKAGVDELKEFAQILDIHHIPADEKELLINCIIPGIPQIDEINRVATYTLLLQLAQDKNQMLEVDDILSASMRPQKYDMELFHNMKNGWLAYLIRDMLAVVHESTFRLVTNIIHKIKDKQPPHYRIVLQELFSHQNELIDQFDELHILNDEKDLQNFSFIEFEKQIDKQLTNKSYHAGLARWENGLNELQIIESSLHSDFYNLLLLPACWVLAARRIDPETQTDFNQQLSIRGGRFELTTILSKLEQYRTENWKLLDVCTDLVTSTVQQHLNIVMSRMQNRSENVAVIYKENECWLPVNDKTFEGGRTVSRFKQAIGWLHQLGLVDEKGITGNGINILHKGLKLLSEYNPHESK